MQEIIVNKPYYLINAENLELTSEKWKILEILDSEAVLAENIVTGSKLRVNKSRIHQGKEPMSKEFVCDKCGRDFSAKFGLTNHQKACKGKEKQKMPQTADATKEEKSPEKPKAAKPAAKPAAKEKKSKKVETFDITSFVTGNGGEHWKRGTKFDHPGYKVETHAVMNEKEGYYFIFNTYSTNGVVSLGKSGKGITRYPLKGKKVSYKVSDTAKKEESRGQKKERKGTKTADDVRKGWEKKYKKIS